MSRLLKLFIISAVVAAGFFAGSVFASTTDGTIDTTNKYAWSENAGWINFGSTEGDVHVTDGALTGYAWGENVGWISLNCSNAPSSCGTVDYKVANNSEGTLSSYAWSENAGWISFNPTGGGVTIDSSGVFSGYAWGENVGWIVFNCATTNSCATADYKVSTDWRTLSYRFAAAAGGGMPSEYYQGPKPPPGGPKIYINGGAAETSARTVLLTFDAGSEATMIALVSEGEDVDNIGRIPLPTSLGWDLCSRSFGAVVAADCPEGTYTVRARFYAPWGRPSETVSATVVYRIPRPVPPAELEPPTGALTAPYVTPPSYPPPAAEQPSFFDRLAEGIAKIIPEFLKPTPPSPLLTPPPEALIPKSPPPTLRGRFVLLPVDAIRRFVFAPLPSEYVRLAERFPAVNDIFGEFDVRRMTDVEKIQGVPLPLFGLTQSVGLPTVALAPGEFALPRGVPIAEIPARLRAQLPKNVVFTRAGGERIDLEGSLVVRSDGRLEQRVATIAGQTLELVVRPEKPVKSIRGFVVVRRPRSSGVSEVMPLHEAFSVFDLFARPALAYPVVEPVVEEELVLIEFEYTDPDGDGIYTASFSSPAVDGEYEVITVMDFADPKLGSKEIRLTTVVDPEGYVYERDGERQVRIPGAVITLLWLNPETNHYEPWPADAYHQQNPQRTDVRGTYSFLVPEGTYALSVEAPGYRTFEGKPFTVREGSGIHQNIELGSRYGLLGNLDWKTALLVVFAILLLYNFYQDRRRPQWPNAPPSAPK
ncbi:MAG: carboxypeptidase-like regulatory domain-containing protein [Candidatus Uhrbacteria bacterium]